MKILKYLPLIFLASLSFAQTPNVNQPLTPRFKFVETRARIDTFKSGDTLNTSPTNKGMNGNLLKIDSILNVHSQHDSLIQLNYTNSSGAWFGNGANGAIGVTADSTLATDLNATILRIDANVRLNCGGFRIFADSIFLASGSVISDTGQKGNDGVAGGNGVCPSTSGSGGATAGAALNGKVDGYLARDLASAGSINGAGSVGTQSGNTTNGVAGQVIATLVGSAGVAGGAGGSTTGHTAGTGGGAGGVTALASNFGSCFYILPLVTNRVSSTATASIFRVAGFSGGGAGGCGDNGAGSAFGQGGGGGSAGAPGGYTIVAARTIVGTGLISAKGGKGGNGGKGGDSGGGGCAASCGAGGGGGGGGGTGGFVVVICHALGSSVTFSVAGGTGGTGGTAGSGSCTPGSGSNGSNGNAGKLFKILL